MGGKAKPTKHTAKEIAGKIHAAKMRAGGAGGGANGKVSRIAPKEGKKDIYIQCEKCLTMQPSLKSMQIHYEAKHPKENWAEAQNLYNKDEEIDEGEEYQKYEEPAYEEDANEEDNGEKK
jgi:hypothetical protein